MAKLRAVSNRAAGIAAITGGMILLDNGTAAAPAYSFASATDMGLYRRSTSILGIATAGAEQVSVSNNLLQLRSTTQFSWSATTDASGSGDIILARGAAGVLSIYGSAISVLASVRKYGGNSGYVEWGSVSENLTLSTSGTTTDTAADLLPANSYIESVTGRITTTIATATNWKMGDATTSGRFTAANATLTAGTIDVGLVHCDVTGAGGPRQTAAAKVRVTTTGTPSAGAIRLTSYYRTFVGPTS